MFGDISCLLSKAKDEGHIRGMNFDSSRPTKSQLLFADDSFMFLEANMEESKVFKEIMDCYSAASGQLVNFDESEMCFGEEVNSEVQGELAGFFLESVWSNSMRNIWGFQIFWINEKMTCLDLLETGSGVKFVGGIAPLFLLLEMRFSSRQFCKQYHPMICLVLRFHCL